MILMEMENYLEPDGLVDHLMVIHSGVGEEAGGGSLGSDAIWSHRWNLGGYIPDCRILKLHVPILGWNNGSIRLHGRT